jgi:hypothetical protein
VCKQIAERDPMNYTYVERYALGLAQGGKLELAQET